MAFPTHGYGWINTDNISVDIPTATNNISVTSNSLNQSDTGLTNNSWGGEMHSYSTVIMDNYLSPVLCFCGFLGNALSIFILTHNRFRHRHEGRESGAYIGLIALKT